MNEIAAVLLLLFSLQQASNIYAFRVLYPQHPLYTKEADEPYQLEYKSAQANGLDCSLFDFDALVADGEEDGGWSFRPRPALKTGERVLYRGWMMTPDNYRRWTNQIQKRYGAHPITSTADYTRCHHLPGWYKTCTDLTAETFFLENNVNVDTAVAKATLEFGHDNNGCFVKDYVKSNTGDKGSIARSPKDIPAILEQLMLYRGEIEGGIALRKLEDFVPDSERRFFVVNQVPKGPSSNIIPEIVQMVAERIDAPFFSVDIAQTAQGDWRVVELGDGQVSDKKEWPLDRFVKEVLVAVAEGQGDA